MGVPYVDWKDWSPPCGVAYAEELTEPFLRGVVTSSLESNSMGSSHASSTKCSVGVSPKGGAANDAALSPSPVHVSSCGMAAADGLSSKRRESGRRDDAAFSGDPFPSKYDARCSDRKGMSPSKRRLS